MAPPIPQGTSLSNPIQPSLSTSVQNAGPLQSLATRVNASQQVGANTSQNAASSQPDPQTAAFLDFRAPIGALALDAALKDLGFATAATAVVPISQSSSQPSSSNAATSANESARSDGPQRSLDDLNSKIEKCNLELSQENSPQQRAQYLVRLGTIFSSKYVANNRREPNDLKQAFAAMRQAFENFLFGPL